MSTILKHTAEGSRIMDQHISVEGYRCKKCDKPFTVEVTMPMAIDKFIKHINSIKCPKCGAKSKNLLMGQHLTIAENAALVSKEQSVEERALVWFAKGEVGMSSKCIANFMLGNTIDEEAHPLDPDDLRWCLLLLDLIPEWTFHMPEMVVLNEAWAKLAPRWAEIEALFRKENPDFKQGAPETYALMKQILTA